MKTCPDELTHTWALPSEILESHKWVVNRIKGLWGSSECREFLMEFALHRDNDTPLTFDSVIWINTLVDYHDKQYPEFIKTIPFEMS